MRRRLLKSALMAAAACVAIAAPTNAQQPAAGAVPAADSKLPPGVMLTRPQFEIGPPRDVAWQQGPATAPKGRRQPNIILIVADDMGYNDVTFNGGGVAGGAVPTPNIVLSAGWKQVHVDSPDAELGVYPMRLAGPFVGAGMSASLAPDWSVYGSVSLGRSKLKLAGAQQGRSGDYMASEFGVRYALQAWLPSLSGAGLLFGYRTQVYRYRDVPFLLFDTDVDGNGSIRPATRTVRQGVDGLTLGIAYSF